MKLKPCRECGKDVSRSAKACPHCGRCMAFDGAAGVLFWILMSPFILFLLCAIWNAF